MAIGRLSVGTGSKGKASPHAQYIAREGKYAKEKDSQEKLEHTGHGNMPKWAEHDPNYFWKMADEHERKNGSTYREHVIALPRELNEYQRHDLVKDWIEQEVGDKHAYQYAIHNPPAMDGGEQPHAHIMFSERTIDGVERDPDQYFKRYNSKNPDRGGAKKANTGMKPADRKTELKAQRNRWEQVCNTHLEQAGRKERISMKTLKERGIKRQPTNFTMTQIKKPEIKQVYTAELRARGDYIKSRREVLKELQGTPLAELNRQLEKIAKAKVIKRTQRAIETRQPPKPSNPLPKEPKPQIQPDIAQEMADKRSILEQFHKAVSDKAQETHDNQLKELRATAKPLLEEINQLRDNKPLIMGRKQWKKDLDNKLEQYSELKKTHDAEKETGVTQENINEIKEWYANKYPEKYDKLVSISTEVNTYDQQQQQLEEQQRQAEREQRQADRQAQKVEKGHDRGMER